LTLSALGKPITVQGARLITEDDSGSIRRNGLRSLTLDDNQLIQDPVMAERIAEAVLSSTGQERRDIELQWRGDPTLELGDRVSVDGTEGIIVENETRFNGALSQSSRIRRA